MKQGFLMPSLLPDVQEEGQSCGGRGEPAVERSTNYIRRFVRDALAG